MGSLSSKNGKPNKLHFFKVCNIDDHGEEYRRGKIAILPEHLVLYIKGNECVRWPLKSLRRYGYDADLFSFESGRRCPTGPGIYAFRCSCAETLFHLLQETIIRAGQTDQHQRMSGSIVPVANEGTAMLPRSGSSQRSVNALMDNYINAATASRCSNRCQVENSTSQAQSDSDHRAHYAQIDLRQINKGAANVNEAGLLYVNSDVGHEDESQVYINAPNGNVVRQCQRVSVTDESNEPCKYINVDHFVSTCSRPLGMINYIQLDLSPNPDSLLESNNAGHHHPLASPVSLSPTGVNPEAVKGQSCSYTTIDLDKTRALSAIVSETFDDGLRRTRHDEVKK